MKKIFQKSASSMMAFVLLASSMPAGFSTHYVENVTAQSISSGSTTNQQITGLTVSATPTNYQTFVNVLTGSVPPELNVVLWVSLSELYTEGGIIKLPLPTPPSGANWTENYGAFFQLVPTQSNAVKEFDTTTEPGMLIIKLKSKAEGIKAGLHSIPLKFTFNNQYNNKVPTDTTLYGVQPSVYLKGSLVKTSDIVNVVSKNTLLDFKITANKQLPMDTVYTGWPIIFRAASFANHFQTVVFDANKVNRHYLQVPVGSTIKQQFQKTYFTYDKKVQVDGIEYDQYIRDITITPEWGVTKQDFPMFAYSGIATLNHYYDDIYVTPPAEMQQAGKNIKIRFGKEVNLVNHDPIISFLTNEYTYETLPAWKLYIGLNDILTNSPFSYSVISRTDNSIIRNYFMYSFGYSYIHAATFRNSGSESIKGFSYELFQPKQATIGESLSDSPHITFGRLRFTFLRSPSNPAWSQYKYYFEITDTKKTQNTNDDSVRNTLHEAKMLSTNIINSSEVNVDMDLPTLNDGEYISKVIVIPMGIDGQSEGDLPSGNSFWFSYNNIGNNNTWPDGTPVGPEVVRIPMQGKIIYLDNPNKPNSYPADISTLEKKEILSEIGDLWYTNQPHAGLKVYSQTWNAVVPGDTLPYRLVGTNSEFATLTDWVNPRMIIRVPKFVTIKDIDTPKTLTDISDDITKGQTAPVHVSLVSSDTQYNYYNFQVEGYTARPYKLNMNYPHFEIPFEFQIENGATAGSYNILYFTSAKDARNFYPSIFTANKNPNFLLAGITREKLGMQEGENWTYWGAARDNDAINILKKASAVVSTSIKNSATNDQFSPASLVPAKSNEDVTIRLTVTNNGSTSLDKLKIYNILPYNNDSLSSQWTIQFKKVVSNKTGAIIKSTTTPVEQLAGYGEHSGGVAYDTDIQGTLPGTWTNSMQDGATALMVDYGNIRLAPGESIETDLIFTIPDGVSQTVFNQFRYSAQEVGNPNLKFNLNSAKAGFSTEYKDNVAPTVVLIGKNSVTLPVGDAFIDQWANWTDNIDGKGKIPKGKIISKNNQPYTSDDAPAEVGTYVLEYSYTDAAGNVSNKVTRTVIISPADKTELQKTSDIATNLKDNPKLVWINGIDTDVAKKTLNDTLAAGLDVLANPNATQSEVNNATNILKNALKNVAVDSIAPVITFPNNIQNTFVVGTPVNISENITASDKILETDNQLKNLTNSIQVTSQPDFDANTVGTYVINYTVTDAVGNKTTKNRTIKITEADKTALIAKNNEAKVALENPKLIEDAASETLKSLRDEAAEIIKDINAKPTTIADMITRLSDAIAALNYDNEPPVISENTDIDKNNKVASEINFIRGMSSIDTVDGDITNGITFTVAELITDASGTHAGTVVFSWDTTTSTSKISRIGDYIITYISRDAHGNEATYSRNITIVSVDKTPLKTKKDEAEDKISNPNVVDDGNKATLKDAIDKADEIINNPNSSQEDVDNAIDAIDAAINGLTEKQPDNNNPGGNTPTSWNTFTPVTSIPNSPTPTVSAPSNSSSPATSSPIVGTSDDTLVLPSAPAETSGTGTTTSKPTTPRVENGNILTQDVTPKDGTENVFSVNTPLTSVVCPDIIRANRYEDLVVTDNLQTDPFHDDIAAIMMFRGAEKSGENIPDYDEYRRHGVVLNTENFSPNLPVTRAEFVKMLVRSLSCQYEFKGVDTTFSDVESDKWYAEYIKFAVENKWINGYSDGTFRPNNPITREEAAKILSRAIGLDTKNTENETTFIDVEKNSEFLPYIESLKSLGVMKGRNETIFSPKEQISRGETARIIYRTFFGGKI